MEVKGTIYLMRGDHLFGLEFDSLSELHDIAKYNNDEFKGEPFGKWLKQTIEEAVLVQISEVASGTINPMDIQQTAATDTPICPVHGKPMRQSKYDSDSHFCPIDKCKQRHNQRGHYRAK